MKKLTATIDIDAAPETIWAVLVDLSRYAEWNPFIVEAEGRAEPATRLRLRMCPPAGRAMTLKPRVTVVEPGRVFEWVGRLGVPGLFTGRHRFELQPIATGTRLVQSEQFTGLLVLFVSRMLDTQTLPGFVAMNEA